MQTGLGVFTSAGQLTAARFANENGERMLPEMVVVLTALVF
jgi:hypothetical protein